MNFIEEGQMKDAKVIASLDLPGDLISTSKQNSSLVILKTEEEQYQYEKC